jgi:phage shock protein PspC (stress-responsive transcriptional regulator)
MENQKKLQRDKQNKVIGGVCSGMANYFGIDAALIRLLFVVAFLFFSTGFWIYVICWIAIPKAETATQKCEMHGLPVTAENLARFAKTQKK